MTAKAVVSPLLSILKMPAEAMPTRLTCPFQENKTYVQG